MSLAPPGPATGPASLLSGLRQRLDARRTPPGAAAGSGAGGDGDSRSDGQSLPSHAAAAASAAAEEQPAAGAGETVLVATAAAAEDAAHSTVLLPLDGQQLGPTELLAWGRCEQLPQALPPPQLQRALLLQLPCDRWGRPLPCAARARADRLRRLPAEDAGLYVPPQPRVSNASLHKLEQRLSRAVRLDAAVLVAQLQQRFPESRQPALVPEPLPAGGLWLDEHGLMLYEPHPEKPVKERPWRRYDQDAAAIATGWLPAMLAPVQLLEGRGRTYRLDVELGALEFELHPAMGLEHQLAARLLCAFREYHRRASLGLGEGYAHKLAALEDGLLAAREALFAAQEQGRAEEEVLAALAAVADGEQEVAELRQLREEEDGCQLAAVQAMGVLWGQLQGVRARQGGVALTSLAFSVVQLPAQDSTPLQADGLTRQQLDVALLVADAEPIAGLPAHPAPFPLSQGDAELPAFKLRRLESMARSHALVRSLLAERLALLQERVSADPDDPEICALQQQLAELGPAPRRLPLSHGQEMALWDRAEQDVAAGRPGVFRPPRLQPYLTVLPPPPLQQRATAQQATRAAASASSSAAGAAAVAAPAAALHSRLRLGAAAQLLPAQQGIAAPLLGAAGAASSSSDGAAAAAGVTGAAASSSGSGGAGLHASLPLQRQHAAPKLLLQGCRYYARLLVNGHVVGTSEALSLRDDFTLHFRDVFSIRLLKWPDSMQLQMWENGSLRDQLVAECFLAVPGLAGSPHIDPQPRPYSWTSPTPVPHSRLRAALAALQPLGALPAADVASWLQATSAAPSVAGGTVVGAGSVSTGAAGGSSSGGGSASSSSDGSKQRLQSVPAVYPSGRVFVRCGWVADGCAEPQIVPFASADGALSEGQARPTQLQATLLQAASSPGGGASGAAAGMDGTVHVSIAALQGGSCSAGGSPHGSPDRAACGRPKAAPPGCTMTANPLACMGPDLEVGARVMPPLPHVKAEHALHRAALGGGRLHHHASAAAHWLSKAQIDPNDPRNAALLELLKAREAAAHGGGRGADSSAPGLFRLDTLGEVCLAVDRAADQRAAFIRQRWQAGPARGMALGAAGGARQLSVAAPLSAADTLELQDAHREALALVEALSMRPGLAGLGGGGGSAAGRASAAAAAAVAATLGGRQDRTLKWTQGALAKALEAREAGIRSFVLRLRASRNQLGGGSSLGRAIKTDDVVKDAPLPEFKLDLSSLAALFAPARPLRPRRRAIKRVQASVPRDTQLVITLQRASNLPLRLGPGGAGMRAVSPTRLSGTAGFGRTGRFTSRDRPAGISSSSGGFGSSSLVGGGFGRTGAAAPNEPLDGDVADDGDDGSGSGGSSAGGSSCLSCFVEVTFRGRVQRTASADGDMPLWNEQLAFPVFDCGSDACPASLLGGSSNSIITVSLFDEVVTPLAAAKAARQARGSSGGGGGAGAGLDAFCEAGSLPQRERRFLGCLRLPLAAVYQAGVMAGGFTLEVPPVLLGYAADSGKPASLALYVTLQPRLAPPSELHEAWLPGEQEDVARHARKWVAGMRGLPQCRGRCISALAVDADGVATLLPRYVAPAALPPPLAAAAAAAAAAVQAPAAASAAAADAAGGSPAEPQQQLGALMLAAARWVAHVPLLDAGLLGGHSSSSSSSVITTHDETLALGAGGHAEHAHLLAGFFLELQQEALVVLGTALTGASAAFVLTTGRPASAGAPAAGAAAALARQPPADAAAAAGQQQQAQQAPGAAAAAAAPPPNPFAAAAAAAAAGQQPFELRALRLWNPLTGHCVPVSDPACELREVGVVYGSTNLWANVQASGHPWDLIWDLSDYSCWRPFFGPLLPAREMAPIQVSPSYADLERRMYEELEARVEEGVRHALYEARSVVVTQPHNKLSRVLKALLRELPGQVAAINAAGLDASGALAEAAAPGGGPLVAAVAQQKLARRLQLLQALQASHNERVAREMRGCLVNGAVLALPFSDGLADAAAAAVLNTGLHRTSDARVKFALAAAVEPLGAAFVCCVWVYVAAIREAT